MKPADEPRPVKPSSLEEMRSAVAAHAKTLEVMKDTARRLPPGRERWAAVKMLVDAGMRQSEVARLLGVSRTRVSQLLQSDDIPF